MADYLNNKEFYKLLIDYRKVCDEAAAAGEDIPRIPEDIGKAFYLIATNTANRGNFIGYTYKDEMINDSLENCVVAVHSFNPEKSNNPFGYFTRIIWYAFLRRIEKEQKQTYVKYKSLEELVIEADFFENEGSNGFKDFDIQNEKMKPIIDKFESKTKEAKKKPAKGVERFTGE
jgi:hypothetical protein